MRPPAYYLVNGISLFRLLSAIVLFYLIATGNAETFKWLLPLAFFTDLIDGPIARKFKVSSVGGAVLDSIADDVTVLAGVVGIFFFKKEFLHEQSFILILLFSLFIIQIIMAIIRYGKISSYHTYLAKAAAIFQGSFMILLFLLPEPVMPLFYVAALITFLDLAEEIILVFVLKEWKTDVKGLYHVLKDKSGV